MHVYSECTFQQNNNTDPVVNTEQSYKSGSHLTSSSINIFVPHAGYARFNVSIASCIHHKKVAQEDSSGMLYHTQWFAKSEHLRGHDINTDSRKNYDKSPILDLMTQDEFT